MKPLLLDGEVISFIKVLRIVLYISLYWSIYMHPVYSSGLHYLHW